MSQIQALPARPNLEFLRKLAKRTAAESRKGGTPIALSLAQLAIAKRFGFASWRKLRSHVEAVESRQNADAKAVNLPHVFRDVMKAIVRRDDESLAALLKTAPEVVHRTGPHPEWGGRPQPLHVAVECGNRYAVDALLDGGADPNGDDKTYDRWSPLMLSIHWKRKGLTAELLSRGATLKLIPALMLGRDAAVVKILKNPSVLGGPFPNDATPLHFSTTVKSARLLIALGVDPNAKDKYGKTAPQRWTDAKPRSAAMVRLARSLGTVPEVDIFKAVGQGRLSEVRKFLVNGADANTRSPVGSKGTLLHAAAWNGHLAVAKLLVAKGADPKAIDAEHRTTPAHWARHASKVFGREKCTAVADYLEAVSS